MRIIFTAGDSPEAIIDLLRGGIGRLNATEQIVIDITTCPREAAPPLVPLVVEDLASPPPTNGDRPWLQEQVVILQRLFERVPSLTRMQVSVQVGRGYASVQQYVLGRAVIPPKIVAKLPEVFGLGKDDPDIIRLAEIAREHSGKRVRSRPESPQLAEQSELLKRLLCGVPRLTQAKIALVLGINAATFNLCINGRQRLPVRTLEKLPNAFGVSIENPDMLRLSTIAHELMRDRRQ